MGWFARYRQFTPRERAVMDGRLITYHFYVAAATLIAMGAVGANRGEATSTVAMFMGGVCLVAGVGLHLMHNFLMKRPEREAYLTALGGILGRRSFPVVPSVFAALAGVSFLFLILYIL